jgi:hypothetical protein
LVKVFIACVLLHNLIDIMLTFWAIAHKRHVAYQDIEKLGQFVEMMHA